MSWGYFDGAWIETYEMRHQLQIEDAEFEMVERQPELPTEITTQ